MNRGFKVQVLAAISSHPIPHHYQGELLIPVCGCGREMCVHWEVPMRLVKIGEGSL